jgi:hypothetical protein
MNSNDLVDRHEVAINSLEFDRRVRELRRVTALGWLAVFLLVAILFVVAATVRNPRAESCRKKAGRHESQHSCD